MRAVGAFDLPNADSANIKTLNLCIAPGAYTEAFLEQHANASVYGLTLPFESGGHKMIIPYGPLDPRVDVRFMDITMLLYEMCDKDFIIPSTHPDAKAFITESPFSDETFDLVLCDGQALRTHHRAGYRETREPVRLLATQLVFGMSRIKSGGTFVILLHKADAYDTVKLLKSFCSMADVTLFKPKAAHRQRSTFYMIAKDLQSTSTAAKGFIEEWKQAWIRATFGGAEGTGIDAESPDAAEVNALMQEFGPTLIRMAQDIWSIQVHALNKSKWLPGSLKTDPSPAMPSPASREYSEPSTARRPNTLSGMQSPFANAPWQSRASDGPRSSASPFTPSSRQHGEPPTSRRPSTVSGMQPPPANTPWRSRASDGPRSSVSLFTPAPRESTEPPTPRRPSNVFGMQSPSANATWRSRATDEPRSPVSHYTPGKENQPRNSQQANISEEKQKRMAGSWR